MEHSADDRVGELDAGEFGVWLDGMRSALHGERDADVPCGDCTGCCTSSQFVHIGPDERDALDHIPAGLLVPAPGLPAGHVVLGYDERGHCPMLSDGACSIYPHRPRTCRTYDCRVFPAAGIELADEDKRDIAQRARRWVFRLPTLDDRRRKDAVTAAAAFVERHPELLAEAAEPASATRRAVLAVEAHEVFLNQPGSPQESEATAAAIERYLRRGSAPGPTSRSSSRESDLPSG